MRALAHRSITRDYHSSSALPHDQGAKTRLYASGAQGGVAAPLTTQRATVYRNGIPIGITTVSSGRPGHETPPGVYTILQKEADHRSNLYNNAPMPFMQRLTWDGIALHGGALPGYPASHGCIRLPEAFARLLFAESRLGMMVVVTRLDTMPVMAATEAAPLLPDRIEP
ncbi:L,D-transpeptidase, partial [Xanthomonas hortorum pv. hederae]